MAANASVAVARLGGDAHYWGRLGADALGDRILAELAREGVDVGAVRRLAGRVSPSAAILVDDRGERLVCAYNDPELDTDPAWLPLERVAHCAAVLADVRWPEGARAVLDAAAAHGVISVFDGDVGPRDALIDLAQRADHVVFSEPGLERATGASSPGQGLAAWPDPSAGSSASRSGPKDFSGASGGEERRTAAPRVTAVDTLAAGDVWHGAFTLMLAEGHDVASGERLCQRGSGDQVLAGRRPTRRATPRGSARPPAADARPRPCCERQSA